MNTGFLYVATGERYVREAISSVRSLRRQTPGVTCALFTDLPELASDDFDIVNELRDPRRGTSDKIGPMIESPFEKTVFLDTDTYVCGDITDLFELLHKFDFALTHAPIRRCTTAVPGCPDAFPEPNSGVIAFRRTPAVKQVLANWLTFYDHVDYRHSRDQPALRRALYEGEASISILPPEYNYRTPYPGFLGALATVKVLHGRPKNPEQMARWMNASQAHRVTLPGVFYSSAFGESLEILTPTGRLLGLARRILVRLHRWIRQLRPGK